MQIYRGFYEIYEIQFIQKHLVTTLPVVELGCSIGIVATEIASKTQQRIFSVEANPNLIPIIKKNVLQNGFSNVQVFNYAIGDKNETVYFITGEDNTTGHIANQPSANAISVQSTNLSSFLKQNHIDEYVLVCDIEGAEIMLLLHDSAALQQCRQIIIECHDVEHGGKVYTPDNMRDMIVRLGFNLQDANGPRYVFSRA